MANFKAAGVVADELNWHQKKKFLRDAHYYVLWHYHGSPYGGHSNGEELQLKFYNLVFIGPLYSKMLIALFNNAIIVNASVEFQEEMKCLFPILLK